MHQARAFLFFYEIKPVAVNHPDVLLGFLARLRWAFFYLN